MMPPLVKVCGITNPADAVLAASLGADFIGLIFCPSPRNVSVEIAASIRRRVPGSLKLVGVFKDQPVEYVNQIARTCQLDFVQLHGSENPDYIRELTVPSIKVFTYESDANGVLVIRNGSTELKSVAPYAEARYYLFDKPKSGAQSSSSSTLETVYEEPSHVHVEPSGVCMEPSGVCVAPPRVLEQLAGKLAPFRDSMPPIIIAGSLTDSIVEKVVQLFDPFAIDVASGVEQSPGVKSKELMSRFISKAKKTALTGVRS